jgi:hypothetical protein
VDPLLRGFVDLCPGAQVYLIIVLIDKYLAFHRCHTSIVGSQGNSQEKHSQCTLLRIAVPRSSENGDALITCVVQLEARLLWSHYDQMVSVPGGRTEKGRSPKRSTIT